jgi:prepilin-type N-terminal cleavage/methylation domain-containing protein
MMAPISTNAPASFAASAFLGRLGFSLIELMIALAMIAVTVSSAFFALNRLNTNASASRLYSEALAVAEQQVDAVLTQGPFDPTQTPAKIPTALTLGTTTQNGVLVYVDPITNQTVVTGSMTTTITDPGLTGTVPVNGTNVTTNLNVRQAKVDVSYNFRGTTYHVILNTLRTADQ